ncbi:MAG: AMP-binding protein, partial [Gammaproteobacteria bacterium]
MQADFWKDKYPSSVPFTINVEAYDSVLDVFHESCQRFGDKPAFSNMGRTITYRELDQYSAAFAAYLQNHTDLKPGDRIAVQMPNLLQYPVAVFGAMRAGLIVVNTNPLYTAREMTHQFNDSGAKALVALANFGNLVQEVVPHTGIKHVIITEVGDMLPGLKRLLTNFVVRKVKKMVPAFNIP